jgi:hypothetical protein
MTTLHVERASERIRVIRTTATAVPDADDLDPAAVVVVAGDRAPHPELWTDTLAPVLVVFPPRTDPAAVLASFAAGADACICTSSSAEVTAHLGAMLRRRHDAR